MVAQTSKRVTVASVMDLRKIGLDGLVGSTGLQKRIVKAIACQRYTPSPEQRERVSGALGMPPSDSSGVIRPWSTRTCMN